MKTVLLSCLLFTVFNVSGYNNLKIGDPRSSWWTSPGTIEKALLTVRPKGLFMEYGLYLTFSSRGSNWTNPQDTVEVTLDFDLPENAILHDSWLWIGNDIIKAKIMDKWTASSIYENVVKRRRDPSIIMKQSATQYELRVFPMAGNQTRKVKITYLMPTTWNKSQVSSKIPTAIVNTSYNKPASFPVVAWTDTTWTNPQVINDPDLSFVAKSDTTFGDFHEATIPSSKYNNALSIGFDSPLVNGMYFSQYQKGNEGIYQLALFPDQFIQTHISKKAAILIDYDASNTQLTSKELLSIVKNELLKNLSSTDSFNLLFSNLSIKRYSEKWVAASKTNIEAAFAGLTNPLSSYSNLGALLGNGIDFIIKNGNDGKIVLITDGSQYGGFQVANTLTNDLIKLMNPKIPIHISDYQSINATPYYYNGQTYYGNDYFYSNLSRMTLGSYHKVLNNLSISEAIYGSLKYLGGSINSFDLHTSLKSGFCYSRFTMTSESDIAYVDEAILQVGKFKGEFPFLIEISGEYNNQVFSEMMEIQKPAGTDNDTLSEEIWAGQYIKKLESSTQSNDIINEIIYSSINERILSQYTSFICLEDTNYICNNCVDESQITTRVKTWIAGQDSMTVYPNPFAERLTIELMCTNSTEVKELSIVDVTGTLIYRFSTDNLQKGKNIITWNGMAATGERVKPGVYMLVYKTAGYSKSIKIVRK
ncbi:MAG TPA: hypothetical protein DCL77_12805 [Prolixibacteraceae bacterium]|jgi:Ca-activated chloride channel family protein|nr:hypothetical protein [Prolixibacteraceae bacterium]